VLARNAELKRGGPLFVQEKGGRTRTKPYRRGVPALKGTVHWKSGGGVRTPKGGGGGGRTVQSCPFARGFQSGSHPSKLKEGSGKGIFRPCSKGGIGYLGVDFPRGRPAGISESESPWVGEGSKRFRLLPIEKGVAVVNRRERSLKRGGPFSAIP